MTILWDRTPDCMSYWENEAIVKKQKYPESFLVGLGSHMLFQSVKEKQQYVLSIISAHSSSYFYFHLWQFRILLLYNWFNLIKMGQIRGF